MSLLRAIMATIKSSFMQYGNKAQTIMVFRLHLQPFFSQTLNLICKHDIFVKTLTLWTVIFGHIKTLQIRVDNPEHEAQVVHECLNMGVVSYKQSLFYFM